MRLAALAIALLSCAPYCGAQIMIRDVAVASGEDADNPNKRDGFTVPTDESLQTHFSDFERHVERKAWEKAFASLNEIPPEKRSGMLARKDGLIIPAQQRIWEAIASLPADGREAFRVFYDAKAKQQWDTVVNGQGTGKEQQDAAWRVFNEFFLTSVGDNAADFIGDFLFDKGDFEGAEWHWKMILEKHPDSDLSEERLMFKRGLAAAEMGRKPAVDTIRRTLEQRFSDKKVRAGVQEVAPAEYLASLKIAVPETATAKEMPPLIGSVPGKDTAPVWRTQFVSGKLQQQFESTMRNNYYYRNGMESLVPPSATDGERVYCNWFGVCFATDLKSGKLLWRSQKFSDLSQHIGNLPHSATNLDNYAIAAGGGVVLTVTMPLDRLNYWQEPFRLVCYDATTGKEKWKTLENQTLNNTSFIGQPLIDGDRIYVIGHQREDAKMVLYTLDPQGKVVTQADLGTAHKRPTPRGYETMPQPTMVKRGNMMYVATQDGALVAFDLGTATVKWLLPYQGPPSAQNSRFFYSGAIDETTLLHTRTVVLEQDGLLYVKEAGAAEIVAVDPAGPSIVWKRPTEKASQLVAVDKDSIYTLDTELAVIDRQTHALRWARRLPISAGGLSALVGPESVMVLTGRGIFELDRKNGDTRGIFRGADLASAGGKLCLAAGQLVAITTISVTSYGIPIPPK
jgi:outer membrane protein assembly factor BamB